MFSSVEFGKVKLYKENGYGFIVREGKGDLFFHMKNFAWPEASENGVHFKHLQPQTHRTNRYPQPGDRVAFMVDRGEKGPVANPWCYAEDYEAELKRHQNWPKPIRYRVVVVYDQLHLVDGKAEEPHVEWGGENGGTLDDLCDKYPRNRYDPLRYFGHDDFNRTSQIQMLVDDKWVDVTEDPRPIVSDNYRSRRRW